MRLLIFSFTEDPKKFLVEMFFSPAFLYLNDTMSCSDMIDPPDIHRIKMRIVDSIYYGRR